MNILKRGSLSVALVCMVLGFMLAIQFRSAQDLQSSSTSLRMEDMIKRLEQAENENNRLHAELSRLHTATDDKELKEFTENLRMISGQTALTGQGIILTIDDSAKAVKNDDPNLYLVHDEDLLRVVNELRAAGAEAISINNQRLVSTSEIRCAGPTLSVNNVRSAPPFEIRAIGNTKDLIAAINMRGGVSDTLKVWGIRLDVVAKDNIYIPAYKSASSFKYANVTTKQEGE